MYELINKRNMHIHIYDSHTYISTVFNWQQNFSILITLYCWRTSDHSILLYN